MTCPTCGSTSKTKHAQVEGGGYCRDPWHGHGEMQEVLMDFAEEIASPPPPRSGADVTTPAPGERWNINHHGIDFDLWVDELLLDGEVVHAHLAADAVAVRGTPDGVVGDLLFGAKGDKVVCPTSAFEGGVRVS